MGKGTIATILSCLAIQSFATAENPDAARFHLKSSTTFIADRSSEFAISKRDFGPFGKPQDPNKKISPVVRDSPKPQKKDTTKQEKVLIAKEITKLSKKLNVLGRSAMIGNKTYTRGDKINISVKGKVFPLKFNSITSKKITFLDLSDKSVISLDMNNKVALPPSGSGPTELDPNKTDTHEIKE